MAWPGEGSAARLAAMDETPAGVVAVGRLKVDAATGGQRR